MDAEGWRARWREGHLGFHQGEVNPRLQAYWPGLGVPQAASVFVPLCGKSLDMHWLRARGHPVIGVELSEVAVRDFFAEAGLEAAERDAAPFTLHEAGGIRLLCGDFFALTRDHLTGVGGVYDRASLVALPAEVRRRYAARLADCLPGGCAVLLVTIDYPEGSFEGPPFAVSDDEVHALFGDAFSVTRLAASGPGPAPPHLAARGLGTMSESVFALRRS